MTTVHVTNPVGETFEDTYRRSDAADEYGYAIPVELIERLEAAEKACDAAVDAIRRHIADHGVPEVELDEDEGATHA